MGGSSPPMEKNGNGAFASFPLKEKLEDRLLKDSALVLTEHNALWCEGLFQHRERLAGIGAAAHEDIERGVTALGPCMNADVAFGQYSDAAYAPTGRKGMQVDVKEGCPRRFHCIDHCLFDAIFIRETFGLPKIDDQVTARKGHAVTRNEVILAIRIPFGNRNRDGPRRSARLKRSCSIDRRHTEFESSHPGTYPSKGVDTKARHCCRANPRRKRRAEELLPQHAALPRQAEAGANIGRCAPGARKFGPVAKNFFALCSDGRTPFRVKTIDRTARRIL